MLSDLFMNVIQCLHLVKASHAEVHLGEDGKHLVFDGLHLLIELLEAQHLTPVPMDFCLE